VGRDDRGRKIICLVSCGSFTSIVPPTLLNYQYSSMHGLVVKGFVRGYSHIPRGIDFAEGGPSVHQAAVGHQAVRQRRVCAAGGAP
jgi:hypothetical protein